MPIPVLDVGARLRGTRQAGCFAAEKRDCFRLCFVATCETSRIGGLYIVCLALGLALRWSDLTLDEGGVIVISRTLSRPKGGGAIFGEPKSAASRRTGALPPLVIAAFRQHEERQAGERAAAGASWQEEGLVFTTPIGTPLDHSNVRRDFHGVLNAPACPSSAYTTCGTRVPPCSWSAACT